jgi:hypothetical protein
MDPFVTFTHTCGTDFGECKVRRYKHTISKNAVQRGSGEAEKPVKLSLNLIAYGDNNKCLET